MDADTTQETKQDIVSTCEEFLKEELDAAQNLVNSLIKISNVNPDMDAKYISALLGKALLIRQHGHMDTNTFRLITAIGILVIKLRDAQAAAQE